MSVTISVNNVQIVIVTSRPNYHSHVSLEPEACCPEFLNGRADKNLLKRPGAILVEIDLL